MLEHVTAFPTSPEVVVDIDQRTERCFQSHTFPYRRRIINYHITEVIIITSMVLQTFVVINGAVS
jgi:hypothetical protein